MHSYSNQSYGSSYSENSLQKSHSDWNACTKPGSSSSMNLESPSHGYSDLTHSQVNYDTSLANQNMAMSSASLNNLHSTTDTEFQKFSHDYTSRGRGKKKKNSTESFLGTIEQLYSDQAQSAADGRSYNLRPRRYTTSQPPEYNRTSCKTGQRHQREDESLNNTNQNEQALQSHDVPYVVTFPDQGNSEAQTDYQNMVQPPAYRKEEKILKEFNDMYLSKKRKYSKKSSKQVTDLALVPVSNGHAESIELDTNKGSKPFAESNVDEGTVYRKYSAVELGVGDALIKMGDFEELNQMYSVISPVQPETHKALDFSNTDQTANQLISLAQPLDLRSQTPNQNYRSSILNVFENKSHTMFSHNNQVYPTFNVPTYFPTSTYHSNPAFNMQNNFYPYQLEIDGLTLSRPERTSYHHRKSERLINNGTSGGTTAICWGNSMTAQQAPKKDVPDKTDDQKRRQRTTYTREQVEVLEASFLTSQYCSATDRTNIAQMIGVNEKQVKIWFQNRRMRHRKANPDEPVAQRGGRGRRAQNTLRTGVNDVFRRPCAVAESTVQTAAFPRPVNQPMHSPNQAIEFPAAKTPKLPSARRTNSTHPALPYLPFESRPYTTDQHYYSTVGRPVFSSSCAQENNFSALTNTSTALPPVPYWCNHFSPHVSPEETYQYSDNCIGTNAVAASSESPAIYGTKKFCQTTSPQLHPTQQVIPQYSAAVDPRNLFSSAATNLSQNFHHSVIPPVQSAGTSSSENSAVSSTRNNFQTSCSASPASPMLISQPGTPQYSSSIGVCNPGSSMYANSPVPTPQNIYQCSMPSIENFEYATMYSMKNSYRPNCSTSHLSAMVTPEPRTPQYSVPFEAYNYANSMAARGSVAMRTSQNNYPSSVCATYDAIKNIFPTKNIHQAINSPSHSSPMPFLQKTFKGSDAVSSTCAESEASRSPPQLVINEDYSEKSSEDFEKIETKENRSRLNDFKNQTISINCNAIPTPRNYLDNENLNSVENVFSVLSPCIQEGAVKNETGVDSNSLISIKLPVNYQNTISVNAQLQSLQRMVDRVSSPNTASNPEVLPKASDERYESSKDQNLASHNENAKSSDCDTKNFDKSIPETNSANISYSQLYNQDSKKEYSSEIAGIQSSDSSAVEPPKYLHDLLNEKNTFNETYSNCTYPKLDNFKSNTQSQSSASSSRTRGSWQNNFGSNAFNPNTRLVKPKAVHAQSSTGHLSLNGSASTFSTSRFSEISDDRVIPDENAIKIEPPDEYSTEIHSDSFLLNSTMSTTNSYAQPESAAINVSCNSKAQFTTTPTSNSYSGSYVSRPINTPFLPQGYNHISPNVTESFYAMRNENSGGSSNSSPSCSVLRT